MIKKNISPIKLIKYFKLINHNLIYNNKAINRYKRKTFEISDDKNEKLIKLKKSITNIENCDLKKSSAASILRYLSVPPRPSATSTHEIPRGLDPQQRTGHVRGPPRRAEVAESDRSRGLGSAKLSNFAKFLQIFSGLVLGCIKTKFCKKICV